MTITQACQGVSKLGMDTAPFIYYVEDTAPYADLCDAVFLQIEAGDFIALTSTLALTEVLAHPLRHQNWAVANAYRALLGTTDKIRLVPVDAHIADHAGELRARYNLKSPDALQIATALSAGCEAFLANDKGPRRVTELRVLVLDDYLTGAVVEEATQQEEAIKNAQTADEDKTAHNA